MKVVEIGPGHFTLSHLVHRRCVSGPPTIGKASPIDGDALGFSPRLAFFDDRSAPVNHRTEHVKNERLHRGYRQRRILRERVVVAAQCGRHSTDSSRLYDLPSGHGLSSWPPTILNDDRRGTPSAISRHFRVQ